MESIKTSENVEFDVIYADGTRKRVREGVLVEVEADGRHLELHLGTSRPEVLFAAGEAVAEAIGHMKGNMHAKEFFLMRVYNRIKTPGLPLGKATVQRKRRR